MVKYTKLEIKEFKVGDKVTLIADKRYNNVFSGKSGIITQISDGFYDILFKGQKLPYGFFGWRIQGSREAFEKFGKVVV